MEMFSKEVLKTVKRLQEARLSLMKKQPFYAVLLLHMQFSLDPMCETAYTDGERIVFCPDFMETLSDEELEFVLMHEVLHTALNHCNRKLDGYDFDVFNTACDIVVNSNILYSCDMDLSKITLKNYGECMHTAPDGIEGFEYTAEEVYKLVFAQTKDNRKEKDKDKGKKEVSKYIENNGDTDIKDDKNEQNAGTEDGETGASVRTDGGFDDHTYWGLDDEYPENEMREVLLQRMIEATQIAEQISNAQGGKNRGTIPLGAQRIIKELTEPQTDWRTVLDMFIQEEITDYSFNPPDRRFQDSPFLLPSYSEKDETVKDILFMIDSSGSMSDAMITQAYSEIYGAIQQFNGNLQGWLGFFDASVVEPKEFTNEDEFRIIRPAGGGGTSFHCIFQYIKDHLDEINPASIIILTDGYAPWPDEKDALDIPVLWLINNKEATPPWGKISRIIIEE